MKSTDSDFPLMPAERFLENMGGDSALCLEILETGLKEGEEQVVQIRSFHAGSDKVIAMRALHSLRGASATFEAKSLASLLQRMESECEVGGVQSILPHLQEFESEAASYRRGLLCLIEEMRARL